MPGAVKGYLLSNACRQEPSFEWSLQHLVLETVKDKPLVPFPKQSVGFIADGVVYNLFGLLHTGGHEHLAVSVRLYLLPSELLDVPLGSDVPSWWECTRCGLRIRWGFPLSSCHGRQYEVPHGKPTSSLPQN